MLLIVLIWRVRKVERVQNSQRATQAVIIRALIKHKTLTADDLGDQIELVRKNGDSKTADDLSSLLSGT